MPAGMAVWLELAGSLLSAPRAWPSRAGGSGSRLDVGDLCDRLHHRQVPGALPAAHTRLAALGLGSAADRQIGWPFSERCQPSAWRRYLQDAHRLGG